MHVLPIARPAYGMSCPAYVLPMVGPAYTCMRERNKWMEELGKRTGWDWYRRADAVLYMVWRACWCWSPRP